MNRTNCMRCSLGILGLSVALWLGAGRCVAADNAAPLQPIPEQSGAITQTPTASQPQASPFRDETSACATSGCAEGDCGEFCDMAICSPPGRFWLRADAMVWWTSGMKLPPLVVENGSSVLYGGNTVNDGARFGYHTTMGMWLDDCRVWNLEFDYLSLGEQSSSYASPYSTGNPILGRPYYDVESNMFSQELVSYPGIVEGQATVDAKNYFQSAGALLSYNLCSCDSCGSCNSCESCDSCGQSGAESCGPPLLNCCRTDLLFGYRYYDLNDSVVIHENLRITQRVPGLEGTQIEVRDTFRAKNEFHGSEIGLRSQIYRGRWSFEVLAKIAMGNNRQTVAIDGYTKVTPTSGSSIVYPNEGVFAVRTNDGVYTRDVFTMIPQLNIELGYQVNCHWRAYVGYNALYWGSVFQAGDQIDLFIDPRNVPSSGQTYDPSQALPFPGFNSQTASFWAQGVNLGTEFRF